MGQKWGCTVVINPNSYYTVQGWMRSELGLSGNALTVYAIIYGFSQDGSSAYSGSAAYLADWIGCSKRTILSVLADLTERGYLKKETTYKNGITFNDYVATMGAEKCMDGPGEEISPPVKNFHGGGEKISPGAVKNFHGGGENFSPHNTRDTDRDINIAISIGGADAPPAPSEVVKNPVKHKHGEYKNVLLTDEEFATLKQLFPIDLPDRIERLSEYIASSGKRYKSHYATIRSWANRDKKQAPPPGRPAPGYGQPPAKVGPNGIAIDPTKNDLDADF